ncbi:hypothetical protein ABZ784_28860 [Streptomyces tendae]|uniref:hypothetical protein n=1 Tax=Streptomyces tendae TaxID=1932 RepID=UPI0033D342FA
MGNTEDHDQVQPLRDTGQSPDNAVPALTEFASTIETSFLEIGQSLTDPTTRDAFRRTLDVWERILQGHHDQGTIDGQQLDRLLETLNGMRQAPTLL